MKRRVNVAKVWDYADLGISVREHRVSVVYDMLFSCGDNKSLRIL
jgi:hypothetical protein